VEESGQGWCVRVCVRVGWGGRAGGGGGGRGTCERLREESKVHATVVALCTHAVDGNAIPHSTPTAPGTSRAVQWTAQCIEASRCTRRQQSCAGSHAPAVMRHLEGPSGSRT
jgi:hypothetical protein